MNNISILAPADCCGCTACMSLCPTKAISMVPDYEGFLYPIINENTCIDCGACLKVCQDVRFYNEEQSIFACWDNNDEIRIHSSSGGVFSALADVILARQGGVCGVGYSEDCKECLHKIIISKKDLDDLRRAKFVQSKKYSIFSDIKSFLQSGKPLLFCGTPCEVGGLRQYLKRDYENLFTCDLICGCVSSPKVYRKYIDFLIKKHQSNVISVNFKDKRLGWRGKAIAVKFANGTEYCNSILDDDYCVSFHSRYNIRPSCFSCKYRNLKRVSDITLGDFWAIEKYCSDFDDNKGTSFVLTNTHKGIALLKEVQNMNVHKMDIDYEEYSTKYNWCVHRNPYSMPENDRNLFYKDLDHLKFDEMAAKDLALIKEERKCKKMNLK